MSYLTQSIEELRREVIAALEGETGLTFTPKTETVTEFYSRCLGDDTLWRTKDEGELLALLNTDNGGSAVSDKTYSYARLIDTLIATLAAEGSTLEAFAFQAETDSIAAAQATPPTANRKLWQDRFVRRLKTSGAWAKMRWLMPHGLDVDASKINWINTSEKGTVVGSPTFVANVGWTGVSNTGYVNTGLNASTLTTTGLGASLFGVSTSGAASNNSDMGATNASSQGITLAIRRATDNNISARLVSGAGTVTVAGDGDGYGMCGAQRVDDTNIVGLRTGMQKETVAAAVAAMPNANIYYMTNNSNGTPGTTPGRQLGGLAIWNDFTLAQQRELYGSWYEWLDAIRFGEFYFEEVGVGTAEITAQFGVYGFTIAGFCAAYEAARAGLSVFVAGGWRDRIGNLGGITTGGLGFVDFNDLAALGGIPRWFITRCNALEGVADTTFKVRPRTIQRVIRELLDPTKNGGFSIPVYCTGGVASVAKTGAVANTLTTADGRTFSAAQWHDASYECDAARAAGIGFTRGREAAGSGLEANNGVKLSTTALAFQPWVTADTPASGLIPNIHGVRSTFKPELDTVGADGTADSHVQAYNYRMACSNNVIKRVPFPSTPPAGYVESNYEFLLRYLEANPTIDSFEELFKEDLLYQNTYDVNNEGFISSDYVGSSDDYPAASYAQRETTWKETWNYILGFLYTCRYSSDPRVPAALKTSMAGWGFVYDHFLSPHENDSYFEPPQMYVRETWRMVTDAQLDGTDLGAVDGGAPRISDHIIAMISYATDSHACQRVAYEATEDNWETRNEGGFGVATGGTNGNTPVPMEIIIPKASECTNMTVSFGAATTHVAFGAYRMEPTLWAVGQACGRIAAVAIAGDGIVQNVDYPTLRTALLASASLTGEVAPVLTQTT